MRVIVANEKHNHRIINATTDEDWEAASLKLLTERHGDAYYQGDPELESTVRRLIESGASEWRGSGINHRPLAWEILLNRSDYEYEHVELVEVEQP